MVNTMNKEYTVVSLTTAKQNTLIATSRANALDSHCRGIGYANYAEYLHRKRLTLFSTDLVAHEARTEPMKSLVIPNSTYLSDYPTIQRKADRFSLYILFSFILVCVGCYYLFV